jgi:hypothetical protein
MQQHPILGPKLIAVERQDESVIATLKEFPIEQMPPIAKQKLEQGLKPLLQAEGIRSATLTDITSGKSLVIESGG